MPEMPLIARLAVAMVFVTCFLPFVSADADPGAEERVAGVLDWPEQWTVFAPLTRDGPSLPPEVLASIPEHIQASDGSLIEPESLHVTPGERHDLEALFAEPGVGSTAWLFTDLHSDKAQDVTIGMGADWWFTAWVNGDKVLATPEDGNGAWPPSVNDHVATVSLQRGANVLAVRYVRGSASSLFAAGGPAEIRAARGRIGGNEDVMRFNRPIPFTERMPFDLDTQGFASAAMDVPMAMPNNDLSTGALVGLERLPKRQVHMVERHGRYELLDVEYRRFEFEPVKLLLSKQKYPAEDRHLDVVLWTSPPEGVAHEGILEIELRGRGGEVLADHVIDEVSETGWFFSVGFPPSLVGETGELAATWRQGDDVLATARQEFEVLSPRDVAREGRVAIRVLNEPGATIASAPMTVGVPFPRGALEDEADVRLVDESGDEVPVQVKVTGRWSRFGSIKWLLCDFTIDLEGEPREVRLEYGPPVRRAAREPMDVRQVDVGFPRLDTGRIRITDEGLSFDPQGDGNHQPVLTPDALQGAFVEDDEGAVFSVPEDVQYAVEELGGEKAVIRRTGWYVDHRATDDSERRFCNFVTRFIFHRDSPIVRIYHTWIFTGDGNRDHIRSMGWRFEAASTLAPDGFLRSFDGSTWLAGEHLVQFDHSAFDIDSTGEDRSGRTPGVIAATVGDHRLLLGAKDFWQNFPSELAFDNNTLAFYNWPRRNRAAFTPSPVPAGEAFRLRYAHEGEVLDFTTPDEYLEGPIWEESSLDGRSVVWPKGERDAINAQGVARTEEMFLYFTDASVSTSESARVMQGLNDETLRAVVDPEWMAASGAFGRIHHQDREAYPREEALYEQIAHAPARWNERLSAYGMWVHGDFPVDNAHLKNQTASARRTWKKGHHGWPYKWVPFARSGDPELFKYAEAGSRQMIDGNFRHYLSPEVAHDPEQARQGWTGTSLFPWLRGGNRSISQDVDHLWHNYYLTGFQRPRDVALYWMELAKLDTQRGVPGRISMSQLHYYLHTYQATFDPWFLIAVHELAKLHRGAWGSHHVWDNDENEPALLNTETVGHFWKPGDYEYFLFTGDERHCQMARDVAASWVSPWIYTQSWPRLNVPFIEESASAYFLTGDERFLGRIMGFLDSASIQVFDGPEPAYLRGTDMRGGGQGTAMELFTGWYIQQFPVGLYALEHAGVRPNPIPQPFFQRPVAYPEVKVDGETYSRVEPPTILFRKARGQSVPVFLDVWSSRGLTYDYQVVGPDGSAALEGQWADEAIARQDVSADAPDGIYRFTKKALDKHTGWRAPQSQFVSGLSRVPVTPHDVPEVVAFDGTDQGTRVGPSLYETQYWFMVPEDLDSFWVEFGADRGKIWNPDGEVVWDAWRTEGSSQRTTVSVPDRHAGQLWRLTIGGTQPGLVVDPQIPPYFSVSRAKWFHPEQEATAP